MKYLLTDEIGDEEDGENFTFNKTKINKIGNHIILSLTDITKL
jgi:hypothetical protein